MKFNLTNHEFMEALRIGRKAGIVNTSLDLHILANKFETANDFFDYVYVMSYVERGA